MAEPNQNREENTYIMVKFYKNKGKVGGKNFPENQDSTRLQEK